MDIRYDVLIEWLTNNGSLPTNNEYRVCLKMKGVIIGKTTAWKYLKKFSKETGILLKEQPENFRRVLEGEVQEEVPEPDFDDLDLYS